MNQERISSLHKSAMEFSDKGDSLKMEGKDIEAQICFKAAYGFSSLAALELKDVKDMEPTRGTMFLTAATLAYESDLPIESMQMIRQAFDSPTLLEETKQDLLELFNSVNEILKERSDDLIIPFLPQYESHNG